MPRTSRSRREESSDPSPKAAIAAASSSAIGRSARSAIHVAKPVECGAHQLVDGGPQQLRPVARFGGEDAQQLGLAVELGEDVASRQRQFGFEVSQRSEHVPDLAERAESRELALDAGGEHRFLAGEVVVDATGSGREPGGGLDLGDAGGGVAVLAEQAHRLVDDALAGGARPGLSKRLPVVLDIGLTKYTLS